VGNLVGDQAAQGVGVFGGQLRVASDPLLCRGGAGQSPGGGLGWVPARRRPGADASDPLFRAVAPYDLPAGLAGARALGDQAAFDQGLAEGQTWTIDNAVAAGAADAAGADA